MIRRWVIRCLCVVPLVLCLLLICVGQWGWYFGDHCYIVLDYGTGHATWRAEIQPGNLAFCYWVDRWSPVGWHAYLASPPKRPDFDHLGSMKTLGFAWGARGPRQWLDIPLYFPTTLSVILWAIAWWKTRPGKQGQGFPVEVVRRKEPA